MSVLVAGCAVVACDSCATSDARFTSTSKAGFLRTGTRVHWQHVTHLVWWQSRAGAAAGGQQGGGVP
jgi:hypothetical protein